MPISLPTPLALELAHDLSLPQILALSGFVGWVLLAAALLGVVLAIRCYAAIALEKLAPGAQIEQLQRSFDAGEFERALELCEDQPTFLARAVAAGLGKLGHPYDVMRTAIEERGDDEALHLHQRIGWLSVLATVAPMLGVAGTVWGMLQSFHALGASAHPAPGELADGIYAALFATLEGLLVAIPALIAFVYLRNRLARSLVEVGALVEDLFERFRPGNEGPRR